MIQFILPRHELIALAAGGTPQIALHTKIGDTYDDSDSEPARVMARKGYQRFRVGSNLILRDPGGKHEVRVQVTQISNAPLSLRTLSGYQALAFGYADVCDLWDTWAARHDPAASRWWTVSKDLFQPDLKEKGFRKFLGTRPLALYTAWALTVAPLTPAATHSSLSSLLQSPSL